MRAWLVGLLLWLTGCAGASVRPHVSALVLARDPAAIEAALLQTGAEADISLASLPEAPPSPAPSSTAADRVASARTHYEAGDYEACVESLHEASLLDDALRAHDRGTAARILWWRAACARASSGPDAALPALDAMIVLELPRPPGDVEAVAASLDLQLADRRAAWTERAALVIETDVDARVSIDGEPLPCAGRCRAERAVGRHLVEVSADGRVSRSTWTELERGGTTLAFALEEASPEDAAREWHERYAGAGERESAASLALLRRALRTERLVLVLGEDDAMRGIYLTDEVLTRAERLEVTAPVNDEVTSLLFELVPWARPEAWWETPWPWIVVGAVVAGAAVGITYYYTAPLEGSSIVRVGTP